MRRCIATFLVVFGILAASPASAQQAGGQFGVGVGITSFSFGDIQAAIAPTIYLPIQAGQVLIEPSLGYLRFGMDDETDTMLMLGAGILFLLQPAQQGRVYAGPRIGILRFSWEIQDFAGQTHSDSETNLVVAGVIGGEYFLSPTFSLGGEAGFRWIDIDDGSIISTTTEFRVRWYFAR